MMLALFFQILLNIEHRLMLAMAPDYDNLPLINKVEVFQVKHKYTCTHARARAHTHTHTHTQAGVRGAG